MSGVEFLEPAEGGLALFCGCGASIQIQLVTDNGAPPAAQEISVTCDVCGSSHWLTITPQGPQP